MVFEEIRELICEQLDLDESEVTLETNIFEDLNANSLDMIDLVMSVEDNYGLEIPEAIIEKVKTVADIVNFIEENRTDK